MLEAWLQERQYATPYHWHQRPNDEHEYQLRTRIALDLAALGRSAARPRLLDIGCGDARFASDAARVADTVGVDISTRALSFARTLVPRARFVASGAASLPFRSSSFDVVTLLDVIEHIPDRDEAHVIAEARRVLRPGGTLVVSTNTDRSAREWKHYRHYPLPRFHALFSGLDDFRSTGLIPYFPTLRFWMAAPVFWRCLRTRVRTCAPHEGQVVVGAATKPRE